MSPVAIIIHGSYGNPNENWFPSLKEELAKNLGSKLIIVKNAGHFNGKSGYKTFPLLLEDIKNITAKHL